MHVSLAGASGVLGVRLIAELVAEGHRVTGVTRSPGKAGMLRDLGAEPAVCDVYDAAALHDLVVRCAPDAVMHHVTDLPDDPARIVEYQSRNARARREGTRNLLDAARSAGVQRFLAQSIAWPLPPGEGARAVAEHERAVLDAGGVVLRYGQFHGPGTYHPDGPPGPPYVHVATAAARTVAALDSPPGIVTIVDQP